MRALTVDHTAVISHLTFEEFWPTYVAANSAPGLVLFLGGDSEVWPASSTTPAYQATGQLNAHLRLEKADRCDVVMNEVIPGWDKWAETR